MPVKDLTLSTSHAGKTSTVAVSAIRNWWNNCHLDPSDTTDSNTEEAGEEPADRRQLSINLSRTLRTRQLLLGFEGGRPILSLRAPRDLVNFPSSSSPRWPIECEVTNDIIHHIEWDPPEPEPFYQPTGHEKIPVLAGEEQGKVVYCIDHATMNPFFTCSRVGGSRGPVKTATYDINQTDFTLEFESRFESGNLQKAVQVGLYDYELTLRTDLYTRKHTQWFYFRVRNMRAGATYRFTIVNFMKSSSLYSQGMRPLLYSERAAKEKGVGWHRSGSDIRYFRNCNLNAKDKNSEEIALFSLTWTLEFPYESDTCYLAHSYPYTYSHLQRYLMRISANPAVASYCKLRVLCHSLAGNALYMVTITSRGVSKVEGRAKKAVVVTARVHPGETNGSWMMEGFLDFLLGDSEDAQLLRDTFIFKVVPMLNPDGVVVGNYRCSLAGRDLNRNYKTLLRDSFPCVWHTRKMVERLVAETDVILYCDFHGHNRKNNVFMYGCNNRGDASLKLHERVFPLMMSKNVSNKFSFKSCKFRVQKSKEGTGRIAMWKLGIRNSYTMEATFGGSTLGDRKGTHFSTQDLKSLGFYFCDTLLDYCDPDQTKISYCLSELAALLTKEVRERLGKDLGTDSNFSVSDLETSTSGSNSSDSDGLPVHLLNQSQTVQPKQTPVKKKKKRLRTHKERNRLRPDRVKSNIPQKELQIRIKNIESSLPRDNNIKASTPEKPFGGDRKKWQVNGLVKRAVLPFPTHPGEVRQVNVWPGCEPVKDDYLGNTRSAYLDRRAKVSPPPSTYTAVSACSDDTGRDTGWWGYSSRFLHLSAIHPSKLKFLYYNQQHLYRQSVVTYKDQRGLPLNLPEPQWSPSFRCSGMTPEIVTPKPLLSGFTNNQHDFRDINSLQGSESYMVSKNSSTSYVDNTNANSQNAEQEDAFQGLSLIRCIPSREQTLDVPLRESKSHSNLFEPMLRSTDLRQKSSPRPIKDTLEEKKLKFVLPPMLKPSGLMRTELPGPQSGRVKNTRHHHSGKERQIRMPSHKAMVRPPQSAPL
ncbi:hypothetical protein Q5P01_012222 [Channa striata]|uniref:Cytosolic carboxypeptidase 2 n=1 Tax=Channa striata TaxID=64152 RepID=A0AA88MP40_CHASR|nr:hypothetical protein Q5P01_012222 [Channa striata]